MPKTAVKLSNWSTGVIFFFSSPSSASCKCWTAFTGQVAWLSMGKRCGKLKQLVVRNPFYFFFFFFVETGLNSKSLYFSVSMVHHQCETGSCVYGRLPTSLPIFLFLFSKLNVRMTWQNLVLPKHYNFYSVQAQLTFGPSVKHSATLLAVPFVSFICTCHFSSSKYPHTLSKLF